MMLTRRTLLVGAPLFAAACAAGASQPANDQKQSRARSRPPNRDGDRMVEQFHALCAGLGRNNRLGVAVIDTGSGQRWAYEGDSRFAMCSTFKLPLAAAILAEAEAGRLSLAQEVAFTRADLLANSPVTEAAVGQGRLTVERMAQAIVEVSDNAAANLLLRRIGGPQGLTAFFRANGDNLTRLDRYEPALNENRRGDPRDTTSPAAMAELLRVLLLGDRLSPAGREKLIGWMVNCSTGRNRLRAGFPAGWRVGDKTGTANSANNDLAIAYPPGRAPLIVTSLVDAPDHDDERRNGTHAEVARIVARALG